jgi:hypothetical protein
MRLPVTLCCALVLALAPAPAPAMCVDVGYQVLAFSSDGESVLIEERGHGPEGGGSLAYLLLSGTAPSTQRFVVSSDMSPGDGSTPESVSMAALQKTLRELADALKRKKLGGVKVGAAARERGGLVTVEPATSKEVTPFQQQRRELAAGGYRIAVRTRALTVSDKHGSLPLTLWSPRDSMQGLSASMKAGGKLLVLQLDSGRCARSVAVLHTPSGKARDLRVLPIERR